MNSLYGLLPLKQVMKFIPVENVIGRTKKMNMIVAGNGDIISKDIPMEWGKYIVESVNEHDRLQKKLNVRQDIRDTFICSISIPYPIMEASYSRQVSQTPDGQFILQYNAEYSKWIREIDARREMIRKQARGIKGGIPIDYRIRIEFTFYMKMQRKKAELNQCIESGLIALRKLKIIKSKKDNVVSSVDGSKICYTKDKEFFTAVFYVHGEA